MIPLIEGVFLFILMTNRPDKLDIDIKRAGRLDRKIPFFYPQEVDDVEPIVRAQIRRHKLNTKLLSDQADRYEVCGPLVGYSSADIEAILLSAASLALSVGEELGLNHFTQAVGDYLPSRDALMLEYMELLAVFECSSRKLLPKKFRDLDLHSLQGRLEQLRNSLR